MSRIVPRVVDRMGLSGRFAIESLVLIAMFAAIIGSVSTRQVEEMLVQSSARSIASAMTAVVGDAVGAGGIETLGADQTARLDGVARRSIRSGGLLAVRVWNRQATIVYSSEPGEENVHAPADASVQGALAGTTGWLTSLAARSTFPGDAERFGQAVGVFAPIRSREDVAPIGALEVYLPFAPIREQVDQTAGWMWVATVVAALVLYGAQVRIVNIAVKRLRSTEAQVSLVNKRLEETMREAEQHSLGTLRALNAAVDAKDSYTARHSLGVADYSMVIGRRMGLAERDLRDLEQAGLLHDLGKIGVPESILLKPKRLTREEFLVVCDHSETGARIIDSIPSLRRLVPIVRHHHERWDGAGYPAALAGSEIPLLARVLAVADAYDAMTSDRPYRRAMTADAVRVEVERGIGVQFDPAAAQALLDALDAGELVTDVHVA